jgi:hypothetical protein
MSWRAQSLSKDAKPLSAGPAMSEKPELDLWPVQPYSSRTLFYVETNENIWPLISLQILCPVVKI